MWGFFTKSEVNMAWPRSFFLRVDDSVEVHKRERKGRAQYPAILTE